MSQMVKRLQGQAGLEEGQEKGAPTIAVAREAVQCTDRTDNMNYEDFIYISCVEEKKFDETKSKFVV